MASTCQRFATEWSGRPNCCASSWSFFRPSSRSSSLVQGRSPRRGCDNPRCCRRCRTATTVRPNRRAKSSSFILPSHSSSSVVHLRKVELKLGIRSLRRFCFTAVSGRPNSKAASRSDIWPSSLISSGDHLQPVCGCDVSMSGMRNSYLSRRRCKIKSAGYSLAVSSFCKRSFRTSLTFNLLGRSHRVISCGFIILL